MCDLFVKTRHLRVNLVFISKYLLSGHNSKKQSHIFFNRFQKQSFIDIFSEEAARSFKNIEMFI